MRTCTKCRVKEPRSKTASYCKECFNVYMKEYYVKNFEQIKKSSTFRRNIIRDIVKKAKDIPCTDCKKKYPYYVMDLDHIRGKKKFDLSVARHKIPSVVLEEIKKCEVVCANCHRERTFSRMADSSTS